MKSEDRFTVSVGDVIRVKEKVPPGRDYPGHEIVGEVKATEFGRHDRGAIEFTNGTVIQASRYSLVEFLVQSPLFPPVGTFVRGVATDGGRYAVPFVGVVTPALATAPDDSRVRVLDARGAVSYINRGQVKAIEAVESLVVENG